MSGSPPKSSPPKGTSPKHSLAERLQRSRRHRSWANAQLDAGSVGANSVSSVGNVSASSEPSPHQKRIRSKMAHALSSNASMDGNSVSSAVSQTSSPDKSSPDKPQTLANRRIRAMQLQRKRGMSSSSSYASQPTPAFPVTKPSPKPSTGLAKPPAVGPSDSSSVTSPVVSAPPSSSSAPPVARSSMPVALTPAIVPEAPPPPQESHETEQIPISDSTTSRKVPNSIPDIPSTSESLVSRKIQNELPAAHSRMAANHTPFSNPALISKRFPSNQPATPDRASNPPYMTAKTPEERSAPVQATKTDALALTPTAPSDFSQNRFQTPPLSQNRFLSQPSTQGSRSSASQPRFSPPPTQPSSVNNRFQNLPQLQNRFTSPPSAQQGRFPSQQVAQQTLNTKPSKPGMTPVVTDHDSRAYDKHIRFPAKQPSSPCESVQYQADAMKGNLNEPSSIKNALPSSTSTSPSPHKSFPTSNVKDNSFISSQSQFKLNSTHKIQHNLTSSTSSGNHLDHVATKAKPSIAGLHSQTTDIPTISSGKSKPSERVVIETPKSASVAALMASFNTRGSREPIMPMNSKDPRVLQSIPGGLTTKTEDSLEQSDRKRIQNQFPRPYNSSSASVSPGPRKLRETPTKQLPWQKNTSHSNRVEDTPESQSEPTSPKAYIGSKSYAQSPSQVPWAGGISRVAKGEQKSSSASDSLKSTKAEKTETDGLSKQSHLPRQYRSNTGPQVWQNWPLNSQPLPKQEQPSVANLKSTWQNRPSPQKDISRQQQQHHAWQNRLRSEHSVVVPTPDGAMESKTQHSSWQRPRPRGPVIQKDSEVTSSYAQSPWQDRSQLHGRSPQTEKSWQSRSQQQSGSEGTKQSQDHQHPSPSASTLSSLTLNPNDAIKKSLGPVILHQREPQKLSLGPVILPQKHPPEKRLAPFVLPQNQSSKECKALITPTKLDHDNDSAGNKPASHTYAMLFGKEDSLNPTLFLRETPSKSLPPVILPQKESAVEPRPSNILPRQGASQEQPPPQERPVELLSPNILNQKDAHQEQPPAKERPVEPLPQNTLPQKDAHQEQPPAKERPVELLPQNTLPQKEAYQVQPPAKERPVEPLPQNTLPQKEAYQVQLPPQLLPQNVATTSSPSSTGPDDANEKPSVGIVANDYEDYVSDDLLPKQHSFEETSSPKDILQAQSETILQDGAEKGYFVAEELEINTSAHSEAEYYEEKKINEATTASGVERENDGQSPDKSKLTPLAQMAADSVLISDYEEALKHAQKKISCDEDDSHMSSIQAGNSSALPSDVPLEFQQTLEGGSPRPTHKNLMVVPKPDEEETTSETEYEPPPPESLTPQTSKRYPRLTPSPRDNDSHNDTYRMVYYGEGSPATIRGRPRRRSPVKGIKSKASPLNSRSSPKKQAVVTEVGDWNQNVSCHGIERACQSEPSHQAFVINAQGEGQDYGAPQKKLSYGESEIFLSAEHNEAASPWLEGDRNDFCDGYPSEDDGVGDPDLVDINSDPESDIVFGRPTVYGHAGGEQVSDGSPCVMKRSHAIDDCKGGRVGNNSQDQMRPLVAPSPERPRAGASQILKFWSSTSVSKEEQVEAEQFDDAEQWVDRDPDLDGLRDGSVSPPPEDEKRVRIDDPPRINTQELNALKGWRNENAGALSDSAVRPSLEQNLMTPNSRAWIFQDSFAAQSRSNQLVPSKGTTRKSNDIGDVFDPFGGSEDLRITNSEELFAPLPDPFVKEDSFSPPVWDTPRGRLSYSSSPDYRLEI